MDISLSEILKAVEGKPLVALHENFFLNKISTDTRTLQKNDVFVALEGARFDGHDFITDAIRKGARHFIISKTKSLKEEHKKNANFIVVQDTLKAYGDLAKFYRQKFKIPAVAITGSSGKTTVKELVAHLLTGHLKVLKNRGTENNLVGVPKTIFQLEDSHEAIVLEMGTNQPGEIDRLSSIIRPQVGVVTQIGHSHLEGLKNIEGVREEKLKILYHIERGGLLILNGEDPLLSQAQSGVHRVLRAGFAKEGNNFTAERIWCHEAGSSFYLDGKDLFETQLIGRHNILNCLISLVVANSLGAETALLQKNLASFKPVAGRLCPKNVEGIFFIDDTYNSNPLSFRAALETLKNFKIRGKKGIVCGDMLELGESAVEMHRQLGTFIAELLPDFVIAAGPLSKYLVEAALKNGFDASRITHVKDSEEAGQACRKCVSAGDMVLVKGSRAMQMEKVFECFITSSIP